MMRCRIAMSSGCTCLIAVSQRVYGSSAQTLVEFMRDQVGVLGMGCVAKAWARGNGTVKGKEEARAFLVALDEVFERTDSRDGLAEDWACEMRRLRSAVENW
jgi:hypothetical protein